MRFPNKAGDHADTDDILRAELKAAGIPTLQEAEGQLPDFLAEHIRRNSGEVKTSVIGMLHGWEFERAWYYWRAKGPGLDINKASALHEKYGQEVRVAGHAGCPHPREWYKGFAVPDYHIDTAEGLKALADAIKEVYEENQAPIRKQLLNEGRAATIETWVDDAGVIRHFLLTQDPGKPLSTYLDGVQVDLIPRPVKTTATPILDQLG